jgi:GMP synthase (glutamine-hydrolysing)
MLGGRVEGGHGTRNSAAPTWNPRDPCGRPDLTGWFLDGREAGLDEPWRPGHRIARASRSTAPRPGAPFAITADAAPALLRVQFHPEVHHTPNGAAATRISCGSRGSRATGPWAPIATRRSRIREQVGDAKVICGLSGGVDSSVAAVLIHEAIGDQLTCVFVDHGLLRQNEAEEVVGLFRDHYNIPLIHADESDAVPRRVGRALPTPRQAQDHRQAVHRRVRGPRRSGSRGRGSWPRARFTPM